jgi:hypothetical protein
MSLDMRSFFVGIATVLGILAVGFGGGVMMGGILSSDSRSLNKIERQAAQDGAASKDQKQAKADLKEIEPASRHPAITRPTPAPTASANDPVPDTASASAEGRSTTLQEAPQAESKPLTQPGQSSQRSTSTTHALGPEKPVALTHSAEERSAKWAGPSSASSLFNVAQSRSKMLSDASDWRSNCLAWLAVCRPPPNLGISARCHSTIAVPLRTCRSAISS